MKDEIKNSISDAYSKIAQSNTGCGYNSTTATVEKLSKEAGYSDEQLSSGPEEANMGLSCGNPTAIAQINKGQTVLDLGSGAGFDCFLAAKQVGETGHVIGVDMTPAMVDKATTIAKQRGIKNVDFKLGHLENLPIADNTIDVIISNCVINLVSDKLKAFQEAYRVLKPGGRLSISDVALQQSLPEYILKMEDAYVSCIAHALPIDRYKLILEQAGFKNIQVTIKGSSSCISEETTDPIGKAIHEKMGNKININEFLKSISIQAFK